MPGHRVPWLLVAVVLAVLCARPVAARHPTGSYTRGSQPSAGASVFESVKKHFMAQYEVLDNLPAAATGAVKFGRALAGYPSMGRVREVHPNTVDARNQIAEKKVPEEYLQQFVRGDIDSARRLAASTDCKAGGVSTAVTTTTYLCNGAEVTAAQYQTIQQLQALQDVINNNSTGNATVPAGVPTIPALEQNCTMVESVAPQCVCPLDRLGPQCATKRQITCELSYDNPEYTSCVLDGGRAYNGYVPKNGGAPPCLFVGTDTIELPMHMSCRFKEAQSPQCNGTEIPAATRESAGEAAAPFYGMEGCIEETFSYWTATVNRTAAFSEAVEMTISMRPVNFNLLSDESGVVKMPLAAAHINGSKSVRMPFTAADMPPRFTAGGRVFIEVEVNDAPSHVAVTGAHVVADMTGYSTPPPDDGMGAGIVVLIILLVLCVIVIAGLVYWRWFRKKKPEEMRAARATPPPSRAKQA